jgi:dTDP-4-amino-4,6-dideoxygalactose transaminase
MRFIPLASPNITDVDIDSAVRVLRSGMLVQGENVLALEGAVAERLGIKHVIATTSGTAALHLALTALAIGPGDEVIVPAFSFVATANVVEIVGAKCVFVDIDPDTFNIDVARIESAITPKTRAIIPVHEFGLACNISQVVNLACRHGLFVIEDAACALGAAENETSVGSFGDVGCFSLHPRKAITSGEGGLLTTNDAATAAKLRSLRNHGIELRNGKKEFVAPGFNYRMTDFQAALVRSQLSRLDGHLDRRAVLADVYAAELGDAENLKLPFVPKNERHTWQTYYVVVDKRSDRDDLIEKLKRSGIETNYGAQCIPDQVYYQETYALDCERYFPNAMQAYRHGLSLPLYEKLSEDDIRFVARTLRAALN